MLNIIFFSEQKPLRLHFGFGLTFLLWVISVLPHSPIILLRFLRWTKCHSVSSQHRRHRCFYFTSRLLHFWTHLLLTTFCATENTQFRACCLQNQQQPHLKLEISNQLVRVCLVFNVQSISQWLPWVQRKQKYYMKKHVVLVHRIPSN